MKHIIALVVVVTLVAALVLTGCSSLIVTGSGKPVTQSYDLKDFSSIEVGGVFQVEVNQSPVYSVVITTDDNMARFVRVSSSGDTLQIGLEPGHAFRSATLKAQVGLPALAQLSLSGATRGRLHGFAPYDISDVRIALSGASLLDVNDLSARNATFDLSGASRASGTIQAARAAFHVSGASWVNLQGSARTVGIDGSGGTNLELTDFQVQDATIHLSGGSRASVHVNGRMDVSISGGSRVRYTGTPLMGELSITGGSSIGRVK